MTAPLLFDATTTEEEAPVVEETPEAPRKLRTRKRPKVPDVEDPQQIVHRVKRFYEEFKQSRVHDLEARIQRHAMMRQWTEGSRGEGPWDGSSDVALGDIMAVVLKTEDTLQNAVLSTRPVVTAKATQKDQTEREERINMTLDYQFFREQNGEKLIEDTSCDFVRDGSYKVYTRWITERRLTTQTRHFDPIPPSLDPRGYFVNLLKSKLENVKEMTETPESDGWDWSVRQENEWREVRFYTDPDNDEEVIMDIRGDLTAYDGPCHFRYPYEDILYPYWCENLNAPGPSNPRGATAVILVDYPTLDEVKRLVRDGTYDRIKLSDLEGAPKTQGIARTDGNSLERAKEEMRGFDPDTSKMPADEPLHGTMRRLTCFDVWAPNDEEESIDVVWTVLEHPDLLVRAKPLGEIAPGNPPKRPLSHAAMIPIPGRVDGIGIPELMEGLHRFKKQTFDMMVDSGMLEMLPWFTYRQSSSVNPEEYTVFPGAGWPVAQQGDIQIQQVRPQSGAVAINMLTLADQMQDDLTMVGDLQLGRIPAGKSSALRTSGGIQQVLAQGEARPERILRRYFCGLRNMFALMWNLNKSFLTETKRFRVMGIPRKEGDLVELTREDFSGTVDFDFEANILNSSKVAMQQAMSEVLTLTLNPLALQLGMADGETIYRVLSDYFRALGQQPEKYLKKPTPFADQPKITAEQAMTDVLFFARIPVGVPAEGTAEEHLAKVNDILNRKAPDGIVIAQKMGPAQVQALQAHIAKVRQLALAEQQQQQIQQSAAQLQTQRTQSGGAGGTTPTQSQAPMVEKGDVVDESLPSSGTPQ